MVMSITENNRAVHLRAYAGAVRPGLRGACPRASCALLVVACLLVLTLPWPAAATVDGATLVKQRKLYPDAREALRRGQMKQFRRLARRLRDYPLYPYLVYSELDRRLARARKEEVLAFLQHYPDTPLAARLHSRWLRTLARRGKWKTFLAHYAPGEDRLLGCYYGRALYKTGQKERAFEVMAELWPTPKSLPRACDPLIRAWHRSGKMPDALVWKRIHLAMRANRVRLARHLAKYLPKSQRHWLTLWRKARRNPQLEFNDPRIPRDLEVARWIRVDSLVRLARRDVSEAARRWQRWRERYAFTDVERQRIERHLALRLLRSDAPDARQWLRTLSLADADADVHEWYIVSALRDADWETALAWLDRLPREAQQTERWRYWRGRALEAMGRLEEARSVFLINVHDRSYYGFLSADRAGLPYQFRSQPLSFSEDELAGLLTDPAILRARELYFVGQIVDARREWREVTARMDREQLLRAAQLADQWGWHDRAIATFGQARYWDDLERRFPLAHRELVLRQAKRHKVDPAWAFAIIRQESAFTEDARSHAGALGLMQLLPRTARRLARSLRMRWRGMGDLLNARTNVRLGVGYLRRVKDRFNGNKVLATAAYNAGGRRVRSWLPENGSLAADVWIETVPFDETRDYLKRVLTYTIIYEDRLGRVPTPLLERMPPISARPLAANPASSPTPVMVAGNLLRP